LLNVALGAHAARRGDAIPPGVLAVDAMAALLGLMLAILLLPPLAIFLLAVASVCFCAALHQVKARFV
jgi:3-hydroxymyristoyl/3-hydroxydecanoyl-(acyl carrier protein) dehydratase